MLAYPCEGCKHHIDHGRGTYTLLVFRVAIRGTRTSRDGLTAAQSTTLLTKGSPQRNRQRFPRKGHTPPCGHGARHTLRRPCTWLPRGSSGPCGSGKGFSAWHGRPETGEYFARRGEPLTYSHARNVRYSMPSESAADGEHAGDNPCGLPRNPLPSSAPSRPLALSLSPPESSPAAVISTAWRPVHSETGVYTSRDGRALSATPSLGRRLCATRGNSA